MGIADYIIIGGVVLFALIGLIRGGAKIFFGLFLLLIIMVGASLFSGWLCPHFLRKESDGKVEYTSAATLLMDPIGNALPLDDAIFTDPVEEDADGNYYIGEKTAEEAFNEIPAVGAFLYPLFGSLLQPGQSIRTLLAYKITEYIYEFVLWLVLVILLVIIRNILRKKIYRFLDQHSVPSKIDRLIGVVISLVIFMAIFWGASAIFTRLGSDGGWAENVLAYFTEGVIAEPINSINPFLTLLG